MSPTDDDATRSELPVTAEVGDEGGSYADATQQVETFSGVFGNRRVDPKKIGAAADASKPQPDTGESDDITHATDRPENKR